MDMMCDHCKMNIDIRNPSGYCDHLYYPNNCKICSQPKNLLHTGQSYIIYGIIYLTTVFATIIATLTGHIWTVIIAHTIFGFFWMILGSKMLPESKVGGKKNE